MIYVRKKTEQSHGAAIEFNGGYKCGVKNYLIVDDFISTGATINYIVETIDTYTAEHDIQKANLFGVLCYDEYHDKDHVMQFEHGDYNVFSCDT